MQGRKAIDDQPEATRNPIENLGLMWLRAFGFAGWWFASAMVSLLAALAVAAAAPKWLVLILLLLIAIWLLGCGVAVACNHLALTGYFFRRSASHLYADMVPFCKDAKRSEQELAMVPKPILLDFEALQHKYHRLFGRRLRTLAREVEKRDEVYPPPSSLFHPMSFEDIECNKEWVRSLTRCRAWSR